MVSSYVPLELTKLLSEHISNSTHIFKDNSNFIIFVICNFKCFPVYTECPIFNPPSEYFGNEIRYEFRSSGNLVLRGTSSYQNEILEVEMRRTFKGYHHFFKWNHNFSNIYDCSP